MGWIEDVNAWREEEWQRFVHRRRRNAFVAWVIALGIVALLAACVIG